MALRQEVGNASVFSVMSKDDAIGLHYFPDFLCEDYICLLSQCLLIGKELEVGTCEITALDRDMSHPKRMIARQTARCACRRGQVAGTTKAKPACVDAQIIVNKQWCGMEPCDEGEQCTLLINRSGWSCTRQLGRIKTVTVSKLP
ncbi:hypothetical protein Chor_003812 [Crotalus horridus]